MKNIRLFPVLAKKRDENKKHCSGIGYLLRNGVEDAREFVSMLQGQRGSEERLVFLAEQVKAAFWIAATATLAEELEDLSSLSDKGVAQMWNYLNTNPLRTWDSKMRKDLIRTFSDLIEKATPLFLDPESCFVEDPIESMCVSY